LRPGYEYGRFFKDIGRIPHAIDMNETMMNNSNLEEFSVDIEV
jgi:hypothetical protein